MLRCHNFGSCMHRKDPPPPPSSSCQDLAVPTGFFIIVYFMTGLRVNAGAFFGIYGTCILAMFVAQVGRPQEPGIGTAVAHCGTTPLFTQSTR